MITARIEGATDVARRLSGASAVLATETRRAMTTSLVLIEGTARANVKQDTRALMGSITHRITGTGANLTGEVGPSLRYGFNVERGRRAGAKQPPIEAILPWVRRHTGTFSIKTRRRTGGRGQAAADRSIAFLIARAIGRRGIQPAPFMVPALQRNSAAIEKLFNDIGVRVVSAVTGG